MIENEHYRSKRTIDKHSILFLKSVAQLIRAGIFIDGGYFQKVLQHVFNSPKLDFEAFEAFSNKICGDNYET